MVQQELGKPDEARKLCDEALRRAGELENPFNLASALTNVGAVCSFRREPEAVRELAEAAITLAEEHGFRGHVAWGHALKRMGDGRAWPDGARGRRVGGGCCFFATLPDEARLGLRARRPRGRGNGGA